MSDAGWIRRTRKKQGLKGFQLADRMQVSAARVSVLEKDEARGAVTLKMMQRAAEAMGCKFEYRIVQAGNKTPQSHSSVKPRYRVVEK
ncbi:MAG: helix-turn-helix domain-containing protein [Gammaproteobacteria bacterium]|nr:helix-turn-helix domain-containing protein [Gammaproteobacteria bacterium]MBT8134031.1 helix-turn-helix domain-containing protein [Gammaproteobacteria bacterium]NNJ50663.1 helix-turn-helix domain-containing protein [Gammaproteobacteria bacterium]